MCWHLYHHRMYQAMDLMDLEMDLDLDLLGMHHGSCRMSGIVMGVAFLSPGCHGECPVTALQ